MKSVSVTSNVSHADCLTLMSTTEVLDAAVNDVPDLSLRSLPSASYGELDTGYLVIFCFKWRSCIVILINILTK